MGLLTTSAHHSELLIIALSLISTLYKSLHPKFSPAYSVSSSLSLTTASNSGYSSASLAQLLLSQPPMQNSLYCHLFSAFLTEPDWTASPRPTRLPQLCPLYSLARTTPKTPFFYCCLRILFSLNVFTEPLLRNGRLFIPLFHSNSCICCLFLGLCLATSLYVTI
jgi:hypothetical protein